MKTLKCRDCGAVYNDVLITHCKECCGPIDNCIENIDQNIKERIEKQYPSMWRYIDLLPINDVKVDLRDGWTPLYKSIGIGRGMGIKNLYFKFEGANPTQSYEDRSVSISINKAIELNYRAVGCASTHYIADSVAVHAARAGIKSYIFVPDTASMEKISSLFLFGTKVMKVYKQQGDMECQCHSNDPATCTLVTNITEKPELGLPIVDLDLRTYFNAGYKTMSYEIAEQLGWKAPHNIVIPEGTGSLTFSMYMGFQELLELGLIEELPKFYIVQPTGCAPIVDALINNKDVLSPLRNPKTICGNLKVGDPADGLYALRVIKNNGYGVKVDDNDGIDYAQLIAKKEGIFSDVSGGLAVAGLANLIRDNKINPMEETVVVLPASGYKDKENHCKDSNLIVPRISSDIKGLNPYLEKGE